MGDFSSKKELTVLGSAPEIYEVAVGLEPEQR